MVSIIVGNVYSKIVGFLPDEIQEDLNCILSYKIQNSRFIPSVKSGQWDGVIRLYMKHKGQSFYTGLMSFVRDILKKHNQPFEILDRRPIPDINFPELVFTPPPFYEARDYQKVTIDRSLKFTRGILSICTGGGKTLVVTELISRIKTYPFIFYVLTKDLMEQAYDVLSLCLNQKIGLIGDGKCDIQKITVCTIQTAVMALNSGKPNFKISDYAFDDEESWDEKGIENEEKAEGIRSLIRSSKGIFIDECISGDSKIVTELGEMSIEAAFKNKCRFVKTYDGNNIVLRKIVKWWDSGCRDIIRIRLYDGSEIKCTKNHVICTKRGWISAGNLLESDKLLCVNADVEQRFLEKINIDQENMFLGISLKLEAEANGRRYTRSILRGFQSAFVGVADRFFLGIKRLIGLLRVKGERLDTESLSKGTTSSQIGSFITLNQQKKKFKQYWGLVWGILRYNYRIVDRKIIDYVLTMERFKRNGLDIRRIFCEGIRFNCEPLKMADMETNLSGCGQNACLLSLKLPVYCTREEKNEYPSRCWMPSVILGWHGGFAMMAVKIRELEECLCIFRAGVKKTVKQFANGLMPRGIQVVWLKIKDVISSFYPFENKHQLNYQKGLKNLCQNACNIKWQRVTSISTAEKEKVYDIEVEGTHCFFANGILVHNCHHVASRTIKDVLEASNNAYWRFGGSATPNRESGDDIMIQALLGAKIVEISASYLIKRGWLVKPRILFETIPVKSKFHSYQKIYGECVVKNDEFNNHVADTAKHLIARGMSTLILVKQISHGKYLQKLIPNSEFLTGKVTSVKRTEIIQKLKSKEIPLMIATSLADEGLDIPSLDAVLIAGCGKSSTRLFQRIGRTLRVDKNNPLKNKSIVIIYAHTAKYLIEHTKRVRSLLKREPEFEIIDSIGGNYIKGEIDEILGLKNTQPTVFD